MTEEVQKPTEYELVTRLEAIYCEIEILKADIKQLKKDTKKFGYNPKTLDKVAKLRTSTKVDSFVRENRDLIEFIEKKGL